MKVKDIMHQENFCISPWINMVLPHHGNIRCCNDFEESLGNINFNSLDNIYNNQNYKKVRSTILDNKIHKGCEGCRFKESKGGVSKRTIMNEYIKKWNLYNMEVNTNSVLENLMFIDIRLSNLCNLKCRHCNPNLSSSWTNDMLKLESTDIFKNYMHKTIEFKKRGIIEIDTNKIIEICSSLKNLKVLEFKGGEPLLKQKEIKTILENVNIKNIRIGIITNGTVKINNDLKKLFNLANAVFMHFSIEAGENIFQYIRGTSLSTLAPVIIDTHDNLNKVDFTFRVTQMPYNIFEYPNVYNFIKSLNLKKYDISELLLENWVVKPSFLNTYILPLEVRIQAAEELTKFLDKTPGVHKSVYKFRDSLKLPQNNQSKDFKNFKDFTSALDKVRNTSFKDIEPRIGKYL